MPLPREDPLHACTHRRATALSATQQPWCLSLCDFHCTRETGGRPDGWVGQAQVSSGARAAVIGRIGVDTSQRVGRAA